MKKVFYETNPFQSLSLTPGGALMVQKVRPLPADMERRHAVTGLGRCFHTSGGRHARVGLSTHATGHGPAEALTFPALMASSAPALALRALIACFAGGAHPTGFDRF